MALRDIQADILNIPEVRGLQHLSNRLGMPFALRGGVVRNLMFRHWRWRERETSLFDFVDPFSDVDVLVDNLEGWPALWQRITTGIPFAPFHRWEGESRRGAIAALPHYERIAADRFTIEFAPRATPRIGGVEINPAVEWDVNYGRNRSRDNVDPGLPAITRALARLKIERYRLQFVEEDMPFPEMDLPQIPEDTRFGENNATALRFLFAMFDLYFNALDLGKAQESIRFMRDPTLPEPQPFPLAGWLIASAHKASPRAAIRPAWEPVSEHEINAYPDIPAPIVPWVAFHLDAMPPQDCCHYRDFSCGPGVIAWRRIGGGGHPRSAPTNLAAIAKVEVEKAYSREGEPVRYAAFSIPGIVQNDGPSFTARIDHGLARARMRREGDAYIGILDTQSGVEGAG